ncbi:hypothetical protein [Halosimplex salinum]|uniref:hypothetical protein n=1 Tax=Halosimplex salinum TaxID=1710538 RepID=UPI0013DE0582|nr:hypothetical protein [Halosimplex salinum]
MTDRPDSLPCDEDDTLSKLETALKQANGIDMRAAIEGAIEDRKRELRQNAD